MRKIFSYIAVLFYASGLWGACTATKQNADYSPVSSTSTVTLSTGTGGSDGQGHTSAVHAVGDMVLISAWCYQNCTFPATMTMGSMTATRTATVSPGTTVGIDGLHTGQTAIYYILSASASGNQALSLTVTGSPAQTQLSYTDFSMSAGCTATHHIDSSVGSATGGGTANAPSVSSVTGDVLYSTTVTTQHVNSPVNAPWSCPVYSGSGETQTCNIDVTQNGQAYVLAAGSGTISNNWTLINSSTGYEALISTFTMSQATANACPLGATYLNPATNSLVTLASLGINTCWYVSNSGADTNAGTTNIAPLKFAPGMKNCASNCAGISLTPGTGIIFRLGDTYHFGNASASPYAGVVSNCAINGTQAAGLCIDDINGTTANPIYYGYDPTWSTGTGGRVILTADNSPCNSGTAGVMPDGATCTNSTDTVEYGAPYGQPANWVSSCPYQVGTANNLVDIGFAKNIIFDNFEMTGLCLSAVGQPGGSNAYIYYGSDQAPITIQNNYIHGASHLRYAALNGEPGCTGSVVCIDLNAFVGSVNNGAIGETVAHNVVDFVDSDPVGENLCGICGFYNVYDNVFRYSTQSLPITLHLFHDNLYEYFFENGHSNMIESSDVAGSNAVYNNVFRHVENLVSSGGGVFLWLGPAASGTTDYIFNNVAYDVGALEYLNMGGLGITTNNGKYVFFNNTWQSNPNQPIMNCAISSPMGPIQDANNHYIDNAGSYFNGSCSTATTTTPLLMSNATATADGYTSAQAFAYSPTAPGSPTVGTGTNENATNGAFCSALTTAGLAAAAAACKADLTYACSYSGGGAPPVCPARTANARPTSTAWDRGTYEFAGGSSPAAAPTCSLSSGTYSGIQTPICTNPNPGTTVQCYTTNGTNPSTNGLGTGCSSGTLLPSGNSIIVVSTETVRIIAGSSTLSDSLINLYTYTITLGSPFFSLNPTSFSSYPSSISHECVRLWDSQTQWPQIQTGASTFSFTNVDTLLANAFSAGVTCAQVSMGKTPTFISSNPTDASCNGGLGYCDPPTDLNTDGTGTDQTRRNGFAAYVAHVTAAGYSNSHAVPKIWDTWNEPESTGYWTGSLDQVNRMSWDDHCILKGNASDVNPYTGELCSAVWASVTSVSVTGPLMPTAIYLPPSVTPFAFSTNGAWLPNLLYCNSAPPTSCTHGSASFTDGINVHLKFGNPSVSGAGGNGVPSKTPEATAASYLSQIQAVLLAPELAKPFFDTEGGFATGNFANGSTSTGTPPPYVNYADQDMQAGYVARFYALCAFEGYKNCVWYNTPAGLPNTSPAAYSKVEQWMAGATLGTLTTSAPGTVISGLFTYTGTFTSGGMASALAWDNSQDCNSGNCSVTTQTVGGSFTAYSDLAGDPPVTIFSHHVPIGIKPVLLQALPTFALTVSLVGSGTVTDNYGQISCPGTCSASYAQGSVVTLSASATIGWRFFAWTGCSSSTSTCTLTVNAATGIATTFVNGPCGPPFYPCTTTTAAVVQTPNTPPFASTLPTGTVNTSNTTLGACTPTASQGCMQWVSGDQFSTSWSSGIGAGNGGNININGTNYGVQTWNSTTEATLLSHPGTQTGVTYTNYTACKGQCLNAVGYDTSLNPAGHNPFVRASDGGAISGRTGSSTASGGDNDEGFNCAGRTDTSVACAIASVYYLAMSQGGCEYVEGIKFIAGIPFVVAPFPNNSSTGTFSPCGALTWSHQNPSVAYFMGTTGAGNDPVIYSITYSWDQVIGHSPTFSAPVVVYDIGATSGVLPNGVNYGANWNGPLTQDINDQLFWIALSNVPGIQSGKDTITVTNNSGAFTLTGTTPLSTDGSSINSTVTINGVTNTYTIVTVAGGGLSGTITPVWAGTSGTYAFAQISGQGSGKHVFSVKGTWSGAPGTSSFTGTGAQLWDTFQGVIAGSGTFPSGPIDSACLGMHIHDSFGFRGSSYVQTSGASTGVNCGFVRIFWQAGTLHTVPCNATISGDGTACGGHGAYGQQNIMDIGNPFMVVFNPANGNSGSPLPFFSSATGGCENHYTWQHANASDTVPTINGSANNNFSTSALTSTWAFPYYNEIYAIPFSGSNPQRFGHTFALGPGNFAGCGNTNVGPFDAYFNAQYSIGITSQDGRLWEWSSSMMGGLATDSSGAQRADIFLLGLDLPQNPPPTGPCVTCFLGNNLEPLKVESVKGGTQ